MKEFLSKNIKETAEIASNFIKDLKLNKNLATIVGLCGELGSGKTTFIKYLAQALGVKETIQSPTFVIMKSYKLKAESLPRSKAVRGYELLIHVDAYRIEKDEELLNLGWQELISDPKNLICIEWADRVAKILPKHIMITFEHVSQTQRKISIT